MTSRTRAMTPVDAAWFHIDGPVNLAQVTGILLTREPLDFARVKEIYRRRLKRFERFRQRVVEPAVPLGPPRWEDVPHFEVDQQMHHIGVPEPRDKAAFLELVGDLASTPLDRERPLWQVHVVDGVEGGSALVMRFHHCMGDGTAMMALSLQLFDATPGAPLGTEPPAPRHLEAGLVDRLLGPALQSVDRSAQAVVGAVESGMDLVRHPGRLVEMAGKVASGTGALVEELLKPPDPRSPLKGEFGLRKRVAWSEPVSIEDVKAIGRKCDAKVNDVLVAGLSAALGAYLSRRGVDVRRTRLHAMVPVDLRPRGRALELGNDFGLVILELATGTESPLDRVRLTRDHMAALKRSPEAAAVRTLFDVFGLGPKVIEDAAVDLFGRQASLVMTNVAGPRERLFLAGVPIDRMMFWVPHPGRQLGMGISILSYAGVATVAVIADAHLVPDPEAITGRFNREFARMLARSRAR